MFRSREKGSRAEIEIAAKLQGWWGSLEPGTIFKRAPLSGGWGDADARGKFRAAGDLLCSSERWPFAVEVKRREGWTMSTLLLGRPSPVWGWWRQAVIAAEEMSAIPMLVFRKNREDWRMMIPLFAIRRARANGSAFAGDDAWIPSLLRRRNIDYGKCLPSLAPFARLIETEQARDWLAIRGE